MTQITITNSSPVNQYQYAGTNAILRIWYSRNFVDSLGNVVIGGDPGYYQSVACTVNPSTHILTIPSFVLTSTTDAQELGATITGQIFDQSHTPRNVIFSQWSLSPAGGTTLLFANWAIYNNPTSILFPPFFTLTRDQIVALIGNTPGISSLNGLTPATQTFATGTAGTNFAISSSGSVHTFNLPTASASNRGLLASADWSKFNTGTSDTAVTPGSYTAANITVNSRGQLTAAANGSASGSVTSIAASGGVETTTGTPITSTGTLRATEQLNAQTAAFYAILITDRGKLITSGNSGVTTFTLPSASGLGAGWFCDIQNISSATLLVNGTINGNLAGITLRVGEGFRLTCNGTDYNAVLGIAHVGASTDTHVLYNNGGVIASVGGATSNGTSLILDSPKIVTNILDTNGNEWLNVGATASAVNQVKIFNAAAGNDPSISVAGADANRNLKLSGKGTGIAYSPDSRVFGIGGATNAFPGLINSGTALIATLADNSGLTSLAGSVLNGFNELRSGFVGTNGLLRLISSGVGGDALSFTTSGSLSDWQWTVPNNSGAAGQYLKTDGTGVTSWAYALNPEVTDTFNATSTWNLANGVNRHVTLTANLTSLTISNPVAGMDVALTIIQGGAGSFTVAWPSNVKWVGGVAPTLSTTAGKLDVFRFHSYNGTNLYETSRALDVR